MDNNNEQRAILAGGCLTLIIAVAIAVVFVLASLLDKV